MNSDLNILLIEDDHIEVMKFDRTLTKLNSKHNLIKCNNGEQAIRVLRNGLTPDIILLDLNMPKLNGIEFLKLLKEDERLRYIPTIILTTSNNQRDLKECYEIGIAGYIIKPLKYEDYVRKIDNLLAYWSTNELISV